MSFAEERQKAVRDRNNQNKRRARQMELRVAKVLRGNRVPMSGAGSIKGDCMIISERLGMILVECKTSASRNAAGLSQIRIDFRWLTKLDQDVRATHAKLGVLIFHYHDARSDYVIVRKDWYTYIGGKQPTQATTFVGDKRNGFLLKRVVIEKALQDSPEHLALLSTQWGEYVILTIEALRELIIDE